MSIEEKYNQVIKDLSTEFVSNKDQLQNITNYETYYEASKNNSLFTEIINKIDTKYKGLTGLQVSEAFRLFRGN